MDTTSNVGRGSKTLLKVGENLKKNVPCKKCLAGTMDLNLIVIYSEDTVDKKNFHSLELLYLR